MSEKNLQRSLEQPDHSELPPFLSEESVEIFKKAILALDNPEDLEPNARDVDLAKLILDETLQYEKLGPEQKLLFSHQLMAWVTYMVGKGEVYNFNLNRIISYKSTILELHWKDFEIEDKLCVFQCFLEYIEIERFRAEEHTLKAYKLFKENKDRKK